MIKYKYVTYKGIENIKMTWNDGEITNLELRYIDINNKRIKIHYYNTREEIYNIFINRIADKDLFSDSCMKEYDYIIMIDHTRMERKTYNLKENKFEW